MHPTWRRSAHTAASRGSPPAQVGKSSEFEASSWCACTLPSTVHACEVEIAAGSHARRRSTRSAAGDDRRRPPPPARRPAAEGDLASMRTRRRRVFRARRRLPRPRRSARRRIVRAAPRRTGRARSAQPGQGSCGAPSAVRVWPGTSVQLRSATVRMSVSPDSSMTTAPPVTSSPSRTTVVRGSIAELHRRSRRHDRARMRFGGASHDLASSGVPGAAVVVLIVGVPG